MKQFALFAAICLFIWGCADKGVSVSSSKSDSVESESATVEKPKTDASVSVVAVEKTMDAEVALASALELASKEDKRVLVHLGAPW